MSGFIAGLVVSLILTIVGILSIFYSKTISGPSSVAIIQAGMLVKLMLAGIFTLALIKLSPYNIDLFGYAITLGLYSCIAFPVIAYLIVKNES
jgi:hypothetical protein